MPNPYTRALSTPVPQSEPVDPSQVLNNAKGFTFVVGDTARLERFLILGSDGGTYYVSEKDLTKQNLTFLVELIKANEERFAKIVEEISTNGRAYRNSPAIFAVALLLTHAENKSLAKDAVQKVCRTSTHLFEFAQYVELLGGWGRAKRSAVASWYTSKDPDALAYQAVKYRQRDGWAHRDLFRLAHPIGVNSEIGNFILGKPELALRGEDQGVPNIITGFRNVQEADSVDKVLRQLTGFPNLPWEAIPTQFLKSPEVWKKLFYNGQLAGQALVRNITRLSRIRAFDDMVFARDYATRLTDDEMIKRTRLHPINYLNAAVVHETGQLRRTSFGATQRVKDWVTSPVIVDALNSGFYQAFKHIEPSNKRTFIGLDVSGSMSAMASGLDLSCAQVGAAMAMSIARSEPYYQVFGFSDGTPRNGRSVRWWNTTDSNSSLADLGISPGMNLNEVLRKTTDQNFGRTNCALPMLYAQENSIEVDTFVVLTDNETWYGDVHPHIALQNYRKATEIDAKLVVVSMTANEFSIANPRDRGMLDVVGCDSNLPRVLADFSAGQ